MVSLLDIIHRLIIVPAVVYNLLTQDNKCGGLLSQSLINNVLMNDDTLNNQQCLVIC